jgi:hypothetical protein
MSSQPKPYLTPEQYLVEHFVKQADRLWLLSKTDRLEDVLKLSL